MQSYEYKVMPAPTKGLKAKGVKGPEARFSNAIETLMNDLAAEGWEYLRADTLPSVERSGLTSTTTEWRTLLVFRKLRADAAMERPPELLPPPAATPQERPEPPLSAPDMAARIAEEPTREHAPRTFANPPEPSGQGWRATRPAPSDPESISETLERFASSRNLLKSER
ncbi:MAG: DUF4177 domain-containing protein [Pseudomonadota bacterium]